MMTCCDSWETTSGTSPRSTRPARSAGGQSPSMISSARKNIVAMSILLPVVRCINEEAIMTFLQDVKFAVRSLARTKGLTVTVVLTLALGIGANAAIFSVVRGVLLRPLVNRDENRLIYIRQSARGIGADNATFSVPEIQDLRARVTRLSAFGEFSTIGFTMVGLGEPREVRAGVV